MGADLIASKPMPPSNALHRRLMLASLAGMGCAVFSTSVLALPTKTLVFPRDRGAHPEFRTEWWYITGQVSTDDASARRFGFQLTFFRSRVDGTVQMTSNFAARQLIFAHAAVTDIEGGKLWHDQRIAREGFGVASASQQDMALKLRDWTLTASGPRYIAVLPATDFGFSLQFEETQSMLLQGKQGLSRKGPEEKQASYYYSQPQLATRGRLQMDGYESGRRQHPHRLSAARQRRQGHMGRRLLAIGQRRIANFRRRRRHLQPPAALDQPAHANQLPGAVARTNARRRLHG